MASKDFYSILNVAPDASLSEIKKQYRLLARKHHPDANNGSKKAEELFKKITAAYETLSNAAKRKAYDRKRRTSAPSGARSGRGGYYEPESAGYDFRRGADPDASRRHAPPFAEEIVHDPDTPTRGFDLQFIIDLPLSTVALGGRVPFVYEKYVRCAACGGGRLRMHPPCSECRGKGQVSCEVTLDVDIPPGVADQFTLRVDRQGCEGKNGGPPGDLLLKINTLPHPRFKRVREDIHAKIAIPRGLAEKGGMLEVETLDSVRSIVVEEGTLTGEEYRIPGAGAAQLWEKKRRGDFIVKFHVVSEN